MTRLTLAACLASAALVAAAAPAQGPAPYPEGYRSWVHISSSLIGPGSAAFEHYGGMHHIYANPKAVKGYRTGRFEDGSVIVFDLFETRTAADVTTQGPRRMINVMTRDVRAYAATGGWAYDEFKGSSHTDRSFGPDQAMARCAACHQKMAPDDHVIGTWSD